MRSITSRRRGRADRLRVLRRALAGFVLAGGLFAAGTVPAAASVPAVHAAVRAAAPPIKPTPQPPKGVPVAPATTAKPKNPSGPRPVHPMTAWSVSISATPATLWPAQYSVLTATTNQDVGPTPYFIYIMNAGTNSPVATCGSGTTCSVSVTYPTPTAVWFYAKVAQSTTAVPVVDSDSTLVNWQGIVLNLSAGQDSLLVGNSTTLTAASSTDIGPSPFYIQIWDRTAGGGPIVTCGGGTSCPVPVSQTSATTHMYLATFGGSGTSYPPPNVQETTALTFVTWNTTGWTISLSAPASTVGYAETVTATADVNVGPTPYYIQVFSEDGTLLDSCGSGTTCSFSYTPSGPPGSNLVAFISAYSSAFPPSNIQASSATVNTVFIPIG